MKMLHKEIVQYRADIEYCEMISREANSWLERNVRVIDTVEGQLIAAAAYLANEKATQLKAKLNRHKPIQASDKNVS